LVLRSWASLSPRPEAEWRVSVTAHASNDAAVRFYERIDLRPKGATLEMPL